MSDIAKAEHREVWRAWDRDGRELGRWHEPPSASQLAEGGVLTVDLPNGYRRSWRTINGELVDERELLKVFAWPSNPFLESTR
ncbi:hypothetical protein IU438_28770 [Nocardia cyriacigeorgica]|uniref:hypothetical protein n=1 Tax=Nocardia cyriacigeorgica TaxID=135487 RepID=UPI0018956F8F|nr:hypothetical protein [Nocardia cyriacigeorgica]MBF6399766.1 hypothetical protein [Nocardia cyriacigeorgica]MBF6405405.1 hypothetical protein [Nocardia cyriacigeorgica]